LQFLTGALILSQAFRRAARRRVGADSNLLPPFVEHSMRYSLLIVVALLPGAARCQSTSQTDPALPARTSAAVEDIREMKLKEWSPRSMLIVDETVVETPKYPAIDVHNHLGRGKVSLKPEVVEGYVEEMKAAGVEMVVNLDGGWDAELQETLDALDNRYPGRFMTFALIDFEGIDDAEWTSREAKRLEDGFRRGAKGLKIHKSLGLTYRYKDGKLMPVDDPKLDPLWELCAKYNRPVMIHSADPAAFFTPLDRDNERWHELNEHPDWLFYGEQFPSREELLAQLNRTMAKHRKTTFICAHMGNNAEDLGQVGRWLDEYPNMMIDIDARISELGRQPFTARRFLIKYQDRVMFGTDTRCNREAYRIYYRFLETDDEYFNCDASHHRQGFWPIYGVHLPDGVLKKLYRVNAERVLLGLHGGKQSHEEGKFTAEARVQAPALATLRVPRVADFPVTGTGAAATWQEVDWTNLNLTNGAIPKHSTRIKVAYSATGVYVLMDCQDAQIVATKTADYDELWREDCFEAFFWPDESEPLYFEYEISPRGFELPLLVPNLGGNVGGWRPWQYEGPRRVQKAVHIRAGNPGQAARGWSAEFMIPYALLFPIAAEPKSGDHWRANFYRVDINSAGKAASSWTPVGPSFHEFEKFGTLIFE
jgi:predicted TIM-barrel fold metal-dependent hydrolase